MLSPAGTIRRSVSSLSSSPSKSNCCFCSLSSDLTYDLQDFDRVSALLRLSTKYCIEHIRRDIVRGLTVFWPRTLSAWEFREANATDPTGVYKPRTIYPHPMCVPSSSYASCIPNLFITDVLSTLQERQTHWNSSLLHFMTFPAVLRARLLQVTFRQDRQIGLICNISLMKTL